MPTKFDSENEMRAEAYEAAFWEDQTSRLEEWNNVRDYE